MVVRDSAPSPSSIPIEEKGIRNKRKFQADSPLTLPNALTPPLENELLNFDLFPVENDPEMCNFEHQASVCVMCRTVIDGAKYGPALDEFRNADWNELTESQLEEILLSNLDMAFRSAIKMVSLYGYSEEVSTNAVLSSGIGCGCKDIVSNIADNALSLLRSGQEVDSTLRENVAEDLRKLEKNVLVDMISVLREVWTFFNVGDALWWLLMSDVNISQACSADGNSLNNLGGGEMAGSSTASQFETGTNSDEVASPVVLKPSVPGTEKSNVMAPYPPSTIPEVPSAVGVSSLPYVRYPASNIGETSSEIKLPKDCASSSNHIEESYCSTAYRSLQGEKPVSTRKVHVSSSRKEFILRQKSIYFEKSYRALGSKAASRARKHSGLGALVKCKTISETASASLKSSSMKQSKAGGVDKTVVDADLNLSTTYGDTTGSSCSTKKLSSRSPTPVADTELSLSLSTTSNSGMNTTQGSSSEAAYGCNYAAICSGKICGDWIPEDKKDEMLLLLVPLMRELQAQLQDWSDWVQEKVTQATRRLGKDKAELLTLKQQKDEVSCLLKERQSLEENTKKKIAEMEGAIAKASGQVERAKAAACRLELENAQLKLGMEVAKLHAAELSANCQMVSEREMMTLKTLHALDRQKTFFQEELLTQKRQLSLLQKQLEQVEELEAQSKVRWRQEEKLKNETLAEANVKKKEREQIEISAKSQENSLMVKSENDLQRCKSEIRKLKQQISQLRLVLDPLDIAARKSTADKANASLLLDGRKNINAHLLANFFDSMHLGSEDVQLERECVMCLSAEMSVVFLPCAHQVVCSQCNELHLKQGMKDCPSCRTPIKQRVSVRLAES